MLLTRNFKLSEFGSESDFNQYQIFLAKILATELEKVRYLMNLKFDKKTDYKEISMIITSGLRTQADYNRLLKSGSNPSKNSDHFYGYQPGSTPTLGAADIQFTNTTASYELIFDYLKECSELGLIRFGQIILEYNPSKKSYWIHFGNDPRLIFREEVASSISRKKYLISMDNGKTYKEG